MQRFWDRIPKEAMDLFRKMQLFFYRRILARPRSTNLVSLLWETAGIKIELKLLQRKLNFYHHLLNLGSDSLAKTIAEVQELNSYPGLISECKSSLADLGLSVADPKDYSKNAWKKMIRKKIFEENRRQLLEDMKKYKKIKYDELKEE